ncbi:hypothetical protein K7X08_012394 [Anisodus acutangulus]|uniref:F-box domain-containing protein n=1 Tax=Anisodus acutangulus TaxID=402998 RepID=A0A9Q1LBK7_9SOLA|nr:hypothetical protein K7X08_012394 [Anisodus acutangulus]
MSVVCKSWKFIVSDNRLWIHFLQNPHDAWDSTFFEKLTCDLVVFDTMLPAWEYIEIRELQIHSTIGFYELCCIWRAMN